LKASGGDPEAKENAPSTSLTVSPVSPVFVRTFSATLLHASRTGWK